MKLNEELRYRLGVASRAIAAILGACAFAAIGNAELRTLMQFQFGDIATVRRHFRPCACKANN